jgi:Uma2 family endonuclease
MATTTIIGEQEYRGRALNEQDRFWELWDGVLVEKPPMSIKHDDVAFYLGYLLQSQLDRREYRVNVNGNRTRLSSRSYYIPDVIVIPVAYQQPSDPRTFGAYADPLPLVVEVWSPSTGHYDVTTKLHGYRERGDLKIWFIHPCDRTLTVWRLQPDGTYGEARHEGGIVPVASLPGVTIDFDTLLDG